MTLLRESRSETREPRAAPSTPAARPVRAAVVGASGYAGGELVRLLHRHPNVEITGLTARNRDRKPIGDEHPHLARTPYLLDARVAEADAVFFALPHGASSEQVPDLLARGVTVIDLGPDFRLHDPGDYPRWYGFDHPAPGLLGDAVYGLPELHRAELRALAERPARVVGSPGCYPTAALLAVAPLARAGLIADLIVDAKSGVSGAGSEPRPELSFSVVNENVRAYGTTGHRHVAEIEQELAALMPEPGAADGEHGSRQVTFIPHLIPMTRGILATAHIRPTRPVTQDELDALYAEAYQGEPFVEVVDVPPETKQVLGSNDCRVHVHHDARTGRILAIAVIDNLVKGAAGQAIQAFNLVHGLPEVAGLEQLPLAP